MPEQKLLVSATLEAVLTKATGRLDSAARAERLKAAALMECAERGYADLTMTGIAKRAKVSTATIYVDYKNREELLVAAMEMLLGILAKDEIHRPEIDDPVERVEWLLVAHGLVYLQPLTVWLFRLHITLAWSGYPHLHTIGAQVFKGIDQFWAGYLGDLMAQGLLVPVDLDVLVPLLLGPLERCTIISKLGCGEDEAGRSTLAEVARYSAQSLFRSFGGPAYSGERRPAQVWTAALNSVPPASAFENAPASLAQRLSDALAEDAPGTMPTPAQRKARILLAAGIECQERGYNAASMIKVAERARVSTATLYKHYQDKRTLFTSALKDELQGRLPKTGEDTINRTASPDAGLSALICAKALRDADPDWVWIPNILMASELSGSPAIVALACEQRAAFESELAKKLSALRAADVLEPCDPSLVINQLLGALERSGVLALLLFGEAGIDRERLARLSDASVQFLFQLHGNAREPTG